MVLRVPLAQGVAAQLTGVTDPTDAQDAATKNYVDTRGGGGTPGGANTQIQFNNNGAFGGSAGLTWNGSQLGTNVLSSAVANPLSLRSDTAIRIGDNNTNFLSLNGNSAGNSPSISTQGSDTNINLVVFSKGTGGLQLGTLANALPLIAANAAAPTALTSGTSGQVLTSAGAAKTPYWSNTAGGVTLLPLDAIPWSNISGVEYRADRSIAPVTANIQALSTLTGVWEFTGTVSLAGFTDGSSVSGTDATGRMVVGSYTAGSGGTNYATLSQVNYDRASGFVVDTLYSMTWRQGATSAAGLYLDNGVVGTSFLASQIGAGTNVSFSADVANPGRYLLNATGGGTGSLSVNGAAVSNPNLANNSASLGLGYTVSGSNINAAIRSADVAAVADTEIATKIGSAPTTYTNSGGLTVGSGFGNAGTTATFITTSYATAKAFLQTALIGAVAPASGLGNWTLPSWPILISNIANSNSAQFGTITEIQESSTTQFLSITFNGNSAYFAGFTTQQPLFFFGNPAFVFQDPPKNAIQTFTVASLNTLQGPVTVAAGTGIGIAASGNTLTVTNTGSGTPGAGNAVNFTNNQHSEVGITEAATESIYIQMGYTSSTEIGSGGTLAGTTYWDTPTSGAITAGYGVRARTATTFTSLNPVLYTPAYSVVFTTPAGASASGYSLDNLLLAKRNYTGNIYNNANLWPPLRDANVSDDIQLIPVQAPTFSVVSSGTNQWTATIGQGVWNVDFSGYNWLASDLSVEYLPYLRIYENSGVSLPPTLVSVTRTSGLGGIRILSTLPGTSGATGTLAQVLTAGNVTGAGRSIVYQDSAATPNSVTLSAPSAVTTSYALKLPAAQATAAGQVLANDGSGNLSWGTGGTTVYSTIPYKTAGGGQGFTYIDFVSLLGTNLAVAQSFFPLNSQFTINRFFGTSTRPVLTVTGAVTSPSANNYRVPCSGLGTFDIYTGDGAIVIRENSFIEIDEPLIWQPSNSKVGLEFDNTLALSSTTGVLQLAQQGATNGQVLAWNSTNSTWQPTTGTASQNLQSVCSIGSTTTTGMTIGIGLIVGNTLANYFQFSGASATATPTLQVAGSDTNISLGLVSKGTGSVNIGNGTNSFDLYPISSARTYNMFDFGANELRIKTSAGAGVSIGNLNSDGTAAVSLTNIRTSATQIRVRAVGALTSTNLDATLEPQASGNVILGNFIVNAALQVNGGGTTAVTLTAAGPNTNIDFVISPKGVANVYPIGGTLVSTAANQPKLYVANAQGSSTLGAGSAGQVLTSNGAAGAPYWAAPSALLGSNMTVYTVSATAAAAGTAALTLTNQFNNLNLTLSTNSLTGFVANATYLMLFNFSWAPTTSADVNAYCSVSTTPNIATSVVYGSGVAASNARGAFTPNGDSTDTGTFGYYVAGATPGTLYAYYFVGAAGAISNSTLTIIRVS